MSRKNLLNSFEEIIKNQLKNQNPQSTYDTYQILMNKGFDEERVLQKLMYHLENVIYDSLTDGKEFDESAWNLQMSKLSDEEYVEHHLSDYQLKKMISRCKKEFGVIKSGEEEAYVQGLYVIEKNLYILQKRHQLTGREILRIVEIAIAIMYGFFHDTVYNYEDIASEDLIYMAKLIEFNLNGYENEELKAEFLRDNPVDMNDSDIRYRMFTMSFRCLNKIRDSIEFWTEEYGIHGYVSYLSNFIE